jgi:hypothetical protein
VPDGNIKVSSVATDLFGVSGRRMLKAVVEGKHDAGWMADYAKGGKRRQLELALEGSFTGEQRWLLEKELWQLEWLETQVRDLEQEIERRLAPFQEPIRRLVTIPGIERKTAWTIVAELGVDRNVFTDAKHLASWTGLCPGNRESGGKRMSGRTRKANRYVKSGLCQAAWAASHTKNTYLSAFYRRLQVRKGAPKAVMALAHHMMIAIIYNVLARREEYVELGADYYDQRNKPRVVSRLVTRLTKLGYYVSLEPAKQGVLASDAHRAEQSGPVPVCVEPPVATETVPMPPVICESSPGQSAAKVTKPSRTSQPPDSTGSSPAAKDAIVARKGPAMQMRGARNCLQARPRFSTQLIRATGVGRGKIFVGSDTRILLESRGPA